MTDREKLIKAMARAMFERIPSYKGAGAVEKWSWDDFPCDEIDPHRYWLDCSKSALSAICKRIPGLADVIDGKAVIMPVEPDEDCLGSGVYAVADRLCTSEYVNGPDASVVLALAHQAFLDGFNAMLAASPYRSKTNEA